MCQPGKSDLFGCLGCVRAFRNQVKTHKVSVIDYRDHVCVAQGKNMDQLVEVAAQSGRCKSIVRWAKDVESASHMPVQNVLTYRKLIVDNSG